MAVFRAILTKGNLYLDNVGSKNRHQRETSLNLFQKCTSCLQRISLAQQTYWRYKIYLQSKLNRSPQLQFILDDVVIEHSELGDLVFIRWSKVNPDNHFKQRSSQSNKSETPCGQRTHIEHVLIDNIHIGTFSYHSFCLHLQNLSSIWTNNL